MKQILQNHKGLVQKVFDRVSNKYDVMNDFMSLGIHRPVSYTHLRAHET